MIDADVIVVGAGPTGLMLAAELCLGGVRPLVLERQPRIRETPKAGGLSGQIIELLRYRGTLERFEAAAADTKPNPMPPLPLRLPFGGLHVDFTSLAVRPIELLPLPQPRLEGVLGDRAAELGAEIRRGHEVVALDQDDLSVTAGVRGPDGPYRVTARYLVGCDGAYSPVREMAGIPFPGITYPEVNRLARVAMPDSIKMLENGDVEVEGVGRIAFGFTRTERGLFALGSTDPKFLGLFTSEDETADYNDDEPMTLTELRDSIRRVLGVDLPFGDPVRLTRFTWHARHVERYRDGRIFVAGDAAHLFPSPGVALNAGMIDSVNLGWKLAASVQGWGAAGLLDTYHDERHIAGERTLLHTRAQMALRRGYDPAAEALRSLFGELLSDEQPLRRIGALIAGTDIRYPPADRNEHALIGTFAPNLSLRMAREHNVGPVVCMELTERTGQADGMHYTDITESPKRSDSIDRTASTDRTDRTDRTESTDSADSADSADSKDEFARSLADLMHKARPIFLNLSGRQDLGEVAQEWRLRVDIYCAETDNRPADVLLIRPDAHIAWAAKIDEPTDTAVPALRAALSRWFGSP